MEHLKTLAQDFRAWLVGAILAAIAAYIWTWLPQQWLDIPIKIDRTILVKDLMAASALAFALILSIILYCVHRMRRAVVHKQREAIMLENGKLLDRAIKNGAVAVKSTRVTHWSASESSAARIAFRAKLTQLISANHTVKRLWQIQDSDDTKRLRVYVEQHSKNDNYSVKVIVSRRVLIPEILIIGDNACSISFPNTSNPRKMDTAINFSAKEYVEAIEEYFDVLWEMALPIKIGNEINTANMEHVEQEISRQ